MQVRTQLAIVAVIAAGWSAGNVADIEPVLGDISASERQNLGELEARVAREPRNLRALRALTDQYVARKMWQVTVDTVQRTSEELQRDPRLVLNHAIAEEHLGSVQAAAARVEGAMNRCLGTSTEIAAGTGCDVRTQTQLALEAAALERMIEWHVDPVSDPDRAAVAHELAARPVTMGHMR